ncbi:hypothetical protein ATJ88_3453 [Isoptericola jiangsuensis]|uniref:Uncharacterized protein n=1 Tax=Isoptericola jiangsuensis TaxID=548579 RepID=A0A2A9EZY6_9MICO|nr:hypothetical protein [Isoptericola jiangsuensis]PFG44717.1 hypothetical protein ATJ88_3453 [Isoptericola jiangsuensis]
MEPSDLLDEYLSGGGPGGEVVFDDPMFAEPTFGAFGSFFGIVVVLVVAFAVFGVVMSLRRARKLRDAGIDPLDPTTDLQIRYMQRTGMTAEPGTGGPPIAGPPAPAAGPASTPPRSVEDRLAEVDRLYEAGTITTVERDAARARVLGTI